MLISCAITAQLICAFIFAYEKGRFSQGMAHPLKLGCGGVTSHAILILNPLNPTTHAVSFGQAVVQILSKSDQSCYVEMMDMLNTVYSTKTNIITSYLPYLFNVQNDFIDT